MPGASARERELPGGTEGDLAARLGQAGLTDVTAGYLTATADYAGAEDFWEPFTYGVGPAGGFLAELDPVRREAIGVACRASVPDGPFTLEARAWCARGVKAAPAPPAPARSRRTP